MPRASEPALLCYTFAYGILYQGIKTAIMCYLGRKLFYKLFRNKTIYKIVFLLHNY